MDTCGFPKDAFYLHKAWWTDEPFVHLLPHWNWDEGRDVRVQAYTNGDSAELFLNGESLGRKTVDPIDMAEWRVTYRPGTLCALAYRGDRVVAETIVETTGPAVALGLEVHPSARADAIPADGAFALPITVFATDAQGRRVPTADDHVTFAIDGPATILGVGNGDPNLSRAGQSFLAQPLPRPGAGHHSDYNDTRRDHAGRRRAEPRPRDAAPHVIVRADSSRGCPRASAAAADRMANEPDHARPAGRHAGRRGAGHEQLGARHPRPATDGVAKQQRLRHLPHDLHAAQGTANHRRIPALPKRDSRRRRLHQRGQSAL
jgi:hypothetical protein